ncbi:hypothetical protein BVRB_7g164590 [Beta vulgaris subsp. vulgaris]|nr:hypothetical protein BVRB_7g164590 [Beta vulgaris subsp. vulgaris]
MAAVAGCQRQKTQRKRSIDRLEDEETCFFLSDEERSIRIFLLWASVPHLDKLCITLTPHLGRGEDKFDVDANVCEIADLSINEPDLERALLGVGVGEEDED